MHRSLESSRVTASFALVVDAKDEAAKAFYAGSWRDGIVERYGMHPHIEFYEVFALTDNARGTVELFQEPAPRAATT